MPTDYGFGFVIDITPFLISKNEEEFIDEIHSYISQSPSHILRYSYNNRTRKVFISCGGVESNLEFFLVEDSQGNKIITFVDDGEIIKIYKEEWEREKELLQKAYRDLFHIKDDITLDWLSFNF